MSYAIFNGGYSTTGGNVTVSSGGAGGTGGGPVYTINTGAGANGSWGTNYTIASSSYSTTVEISNKGIDLKEGADIKIEGVSLMQAIKNIEDRLAILHPNPKLEEKWEQLKELRNQYEALEKDILEKEKLMKILKEK